MPPKISPFRLLDLPRELRDLVYRFMLVRGSLHIKSRTIYKVLRRRGLVQHYYILYARDAIGYICDKPWTNILKTNRQIFHEARLIFYAYNMFDFSNIHDVGGQITPDIAWKFLHERPRELRLMINNISLGILDSVSHEESYWADTGLFKLFDFLQEHCQLTYLYLKIDNNDGDWNIEKHDQKELIWTETIPRLQNLRRLRVDWTYYQSYQVQRTLAAVKKLRTMLNKCPKSEKEGIRIRKRHIVEIGRRDQLNVCKRTRTRRLEFAFDIINGHSKLTPTRRVKVDPYSWCENCGRLRPSTHILDKCPCGWSFYNLSEEWIYIESQNSHTERSFLQLRYPAGGWDSSKWGNKALHECLPEGVTEKEYYLAKGLVESGTTIHAGPTGQHLDDYTGSDFGDTDSLLSIDDWGENMET